MPTPVVAYITSWCPDCHRARRILRELNVECVEIDIEAVPGAEAQMRAINGGLGKVPTLIIGKTILVEPPDATLRSVLQDYLRSGDHTGGNGA